MTSNHIISSIIVTPYFEDLACKDFCLALAEVVDDTMRVVIVDDGSVKRVLNATDFENIGLSGNILRLHRNLGHQAAIATGIDFAVKNYDFDHLILMDSDGEDRPSDILLLIKALEESDANIIVAKRKSRHESIKFKLFYSVYQLFFRFMVGRSLSFGNFMVMDKQAAKRLAISKETSVHVAASALNSRLSIEGLPIDRGARFAGKSKMNLVNLVLHGLRSIMVFAEEVIVRITLLCLTVAVFVLSGLIAMAIMKFVGVTIPGWYSTVSGLLMLLLFQIGSMAVLMLLTANKMNDRNAQALEYKSVVDEVIPINKEK